MKKDLSDICFGQGIRIYLEMKLKPIEQLIDELGETAHALKNAKSGYITLTKVSDNPGYVAKGDVESGWCGAFNEGISCILDYGGRWFHTSVIETIDWDKKLIHTRNSIYSFEFDEFPTEEMLDGLNKSQIRFSDVRH